MQLMSQNDEIVTRYIDDASFQEVVYPLLAKRIYEEIMKAA